MSQVTSTTAYTLSNTILTILNSQNQQVLTGDIDCPQLPIGKQHGHAWLSQGSNPPIKFAGTVSSMASGTYFAMALAPNPEPYSGPQLLQDQVALYIENDPGFFGETQQLIVIEA